MSQTIINAINAWKSNPELYRLDDNSLYDDVGNIKSASHWTEKHMNSLHILYELDREMPYELPSDIEPFRLFWTMTRDDIYEDNWSKFYDSVQGVNTNTMANITSIMKTLVDLVERRKSAESDLSSTSDEGYKLEIFTHSLANNICSSFLKIMGLHSKQYPSWDYMHTEYYTITLLRSMTGKVRPDGFIAFKQNKIGIVPHVWVEAKTLEYSSTRNPNKYKSTIPQKAAESLALVQYNWDENEIKDREVYGIEFSHRFVAIWHVVFPYQYLVNLQTKKILNHDEFIVMRRSTVLDLIESRDRRTFAEWFTGLMNQLQ
jgi:hypothetical protein